MGFTGGWRARQFYVDPPEALHTAAPEHGDRDTPDPNPVWDAPGDLDQVPEYASQNPDEPWFYAETGGVQFDSTSGADHDVVGESAMDARDEGASRQRNFVAPVLQSHDERYLSPRFEGLATSPVPDAALRRGLNADPINNPDGFRLGWVMQTFVDRKMYDPERVHDRRLLTPNTAYAETNQPGQPVTFGNPFASMARAITNIAQKPMIRREPPPIDESELTDGADQPYDDYPDWVAG